MNSIIISFNDTVELNLTYKKLKKQYPKNRIAKAEIDVGNLEDEYLLGLALEREKNDTGTRISFEEHLARHGMSRDELDNMEDVEIE